MEGARRSHKVCTHLALNRLTSGRNSSLHSEFIETGKPHGSVLK